MRKAKDKKEQNKKLNSNSNLVANQKGSWWGDGDELKGKNVTKRIEPTERKLMILCLTMFPHLTLLNTKLIN